MLALRVVCTGDTVSSNLLPRPPSGADALRNVVHPFPAAGAALGDTWGLSTPPPLALSGCGEDGVDSNRGCVLVVVLVGVAEERGMGVSRRNPSKPPASTQLNANDTNTLPVYVGVCVGHSVLWDAIEGRGAVQSLSVCICVCDVHNTQSHTPSHTHKHTIPCKSRNTEKLNRCARNTAYTAVPSTNTAMTNSPAYSRHVRTGMVRGALVPGRLSLVPSLVVTTHSCARLRLRRPVRGGYWCVGGGMGVCWGGMAVCMGGYECVYGG